MVNVCKICGRQFTERGLHGHIIKAHNKPVPEYYEEFHPRNDKLTGEKIPYVDYHTYISSEFVNQNNEKMWLRRATPDEAKDYLLRRLKERMELKKLVFAPSYVEFCTSELPPYRAYVHFFGSFANACKEIGVTPLLRDLKEIHNLPKKSVEILVDTREQRPLHFPNSRKQKLSFGDYTLAGEDYSYTYVDRKSDGDFKNTVTMHQDRFLEEISRASTLNSYIFIVVEDSIANIELVNKMAAYTNNMNYVWSSMRKIQHLHPRKCQFVFTGSRKNSERIIPYLLRYGKDLWDVDVQYLLEEKGALNA